MRQSESLRDFCADISLSIHDFVMPLFLLPGKALEVPIASMPGIAQMSADVAVDYIQSLEKQGLNRFILFGVVPREQKDATGSICLTDDNPVIGCLQQLQHTEFSGTIIADLCMCEYTDHGHCGVLSKNSEETIDNDATLIELQKQAIALANAGADVIAPSGMIDGMVAALRASLDEAGFRSLPIMSYSVKYASSFYGPFRDAADGAPQFGNRASYQLDYRRSQEWQTEVHLDIDEGADFLMVKPGLSYLDILSKLRLITTLPIGVYQVSGEYSMLHAAAEKNFLDLKSAALENCFAFKRAGADFIISYFAKNMPEWLADGTSE